MAISTVGTYLYSAAPATGSATPTFSKLVDIKSFPDLIGDPELLETTTMSDLAQTYIPGLQSQDVLQFTANYDSTTWASVAAIANTHRIYELRFGDDSGSGGTFTWEGQHTLGLPGGDVNAVVEMNINVIPSTPVTKKVSNAGGGSTQQEP